MLNITFKVDKDMLARCIISRNEMQTREIADYFWTKYNSDYIKLQKYFNEPNINSQILEELQSQQFFKDALNRAIENKKRIEKAWNKNKKTINLFLKKTLKTEIKLNTTGYIVSPELHFGWHIEPNAFVWGHKKGLESVNYDLSYMVHESLHSFFPDNDITHAIIENISDIELSKFLNKSNFGYSTHPWLSETHIKIFPFWNLYLNRNIDEIKNVSKNENIKYNISKFEKYREQLSNLNINELVKFLENNLNSVKVKTSYEIIN